jgi:hypothetical protein
MKTNSNFKLSKQTKRFMATIIDDNERNIYKRLMINAQLESLKPPPSHKEKRSEK